MRGRRRAAATLALVLGLVLAVGCGDDDESTTDTTGATTTSTPAGSTTTASGDGPSTTALEPPNDLLADGDHFGFITTLVVGDETVTGQFDLAQLLTGDEAHAAALQAGEEPMDFFVSNINPKLRPIQVAPGAQVLVVDYVGDCCEAKSTTIVDFVADRDADGEERTPVHLTVTGGIVTAITEQYFP